MKHEMIRVLKDMRGCVWAADDRLIVWDGPSNEGVLMTPTKTHHFQLTTLLRGGRISLFGKKVSVGIEQMVDTNLSKLVLDRSGLIPLNEDVDGDVDDKTRRWLRRIAP